MRPPRKRSRLSLVFLLLILVEASSSSDVGDGEDQSVRREEEEEEEEEGAPPMEVEAGDARAADPTRLERRIGRQYPAGQGSAQRTAQSASELVSGERVLSR